MTVRFRYRADDPRPIFAGLIEPVAKAGTAAIDKVGADIKAEGRANIAGAGFSKRWQNALRVDRYPKRGISTRPALWIFHRIPYAEVFESGATIRGKPLLWLPLPSTPKKIGRLKMTPKNYIAKVGPLVYINRPGKNPLLGAKYQGARGGRSISKRSLAGLRRGASKGGDVVPLFVGVPQVQISKRLSLRSIFARAASRMGTYYAAQFRG